MTKATYDAVGDKFRNLWGKEAGWAHSVLFTADLRAFSERLATTIAVEEYKKEDSSAIMTKTEVNAELLTPVSIKREYGEDENNVTAVKEVTARQVKRRRKA